MLKQTRSNTESDLTVSDSWLSAKMSVRVDHAMLGGADDVTPQETGPHLFEFSPAGISNEYHAHSIGARSQSAKTYLEDHHAEYEDC